MNTFKIFLEGMPIGKIIVGRIQAVLIKLSYVHNI